MTGDRLRFLDGLRGLAAFYVMAGHARWLLWEGYTDGYAHHPELYPLLSKPLVYFFLIFSFGHQAVLLFFVLSGLVIHLRYAKALKDSPETARFDWRAFIGRRARRLYPPLIFALLLTFVLDQAGARLGYPIYFQQTPYPLINLNVTPHFDGFTLIGNLAFTMTVYVPVWGSNGPLWSLMFEAWFYMVYPALWWLSRRSIRWATAVVVGMFVLSFLPFGGPLALARTVFALLPAWWFGALLADALAGRFQVRFWRIGRLSMLLLILTPLVIPISNLAQPFLTLEDIAWGVGFTGLIAAGIAWQNNGGSLRVLERLKPLGDMSYTLYVIHFPILVLLSGFVMSQSPTLPRDFGWVFAGMVLCLGTAYAAHFLTEKPFTRRRTYLANPAERGLPFGKTL